MIVLSMFDSYFTAVNGSELILEVNDIVSGRKTVVILSKLDTHLMPHKQLAVKQIT